jgi:L-seryl-tRNA(Ser) seleniumtransferase
LDATLRLYRAPFDPLKEVPVLAALSQPLARVKERGHALADDLRQLGIADVAVQQSAAFVGGGTLPEQDIPSFAVCVALPGLSAHQLMAALRQGDTPVIGRIERGEVLLDMRSVSDAELPAIIRTFKHIANR